MGSYRSYMKENYPERQSSLLVWIISALVAGFLGQMVLLSFSADGLMEKALGVSSAGLLSYRLWTPFTFTLLHSTGNLLHIVFTLLGLYFIGRPVLEALGPRKFLGAYFLTGFVACATWLAMHWGTQDVLIGATPVLAGLFIIYSCLNPNTPITLLLLFIPITLPKTKYLAWAFVALDLVGFVFFEIPGHGTMMSHSANLGAMLTGYLFHWALLSGRTWRFTLPWKQAKPEVIAPAWVQARAQGRGIQPIFHVNLTDREQLKIEVDRILDKINSHGFGSLTAEEKKTLDDARDILSKH